MAESTLIKTPAGLQSMKELPKGKFDLWSYNFEKKKVEIDTAIKTDSGKKKVYRVTTESGKTFEATEDHRFFVENQGRIEEKRVKSLTIKDKLVII
jgi:intein/homing endonuclease